MQLKQRIKRLAAFLLAMSMALGCMPGSAWAETATPTDLIATDAVLYAVQEQQCRQIYFQCTRMKGMNMTLSNSQASRKKKWQSTLRKRKPKRQGSRAQVGKLLPLRWRINSRLQGGS